MIELIVLHILLLELLPGRQFIGMVWWLSALGVDVIATADTDAYLALQEGGTRNSFVVVKSLVHY